MTIEKQRSLTGQARQKENTAKQVTECMPGKAKKLHVAAEQSIQRSNRIFERRTKAERKRKPQAYHFGPNLNSTSEMDM